MTDRRFVLKWAHLGLRGDARAWEIIEANRAELQAHIAEIHVEQEQHNTALREIDRSHIALLQIAGRYVGGRPPFRRRD